MDSARPDLSRKRRRRRIVYTLIGLTGIVALIIGLSRLEPAVPTVEKSSIWTDMVKRGEMLRQGTISLSRLIEGGRGACAYR